MNQYRWKFVASIIWVIEIGSCKLEVNDYKLYLRTVYPKMYEILFCRFLCTGNLFTQYSRFNILIIAGNIEERENSDLFSLPIYEHLKISGFLNLRRI